MQSDLYLDLLQASLTGSLYGDPNMSPWNPKEFNPDLRECGKDWPATALTMIGERRMSNLRRIIEFILAANIPGDFIETGVWRGGACIMMRGILKASGITDRKVWCADSFCGLPQPNDKYPPDKGDKHHTFKQLAVPLHEVKRNFWRYHLLDEQVEFLQGWFSETLPRAPITQLALLRMDGDMYESTMDALVTLYDKVAAGGFIIVDDWFLPRCRQAVIDFMAEHELTPRVSDIDGMGAYFRKPSQVAEPAIA